MRINIKEPPPKDIYQGRGKYIRLSVFFMALVFCGAGLAVYAIVYDTNYYDLLEKIAMTVFFGASMLFAYFAGKLQHYKSLVQQQQKELADWRRLYPEVASYCEQLDGAGRHPVLAEYEACKVFVEELTQTKNGE